MGLSPLMAVLHHLAAFTLVAALAVEVALFKPPLSVSDARRLQRTDLIFGVAAVLLLAVGLMRVFYFEKGPRYYWHDLYFLIKFGGSVRHRRPDLDLPDCHVSRMGAGDEGRERTAGVGRSDAARADVPDARAHCHRDHPALCRADGTRFRLPTLIYVIS